MLTIQKELGTVEKSVLPEQIISRILRLISEKKLKPGTRLPSERQLAESMDVSRQTLRSALRALSAMNVVEIRPGSGAYITDLEPSKLVAQLEFFFTHSAGAIEEYFEARTYIELPLVRMAAARITEAQLEELRRTVEVKEKSAVTSIKFTELDARFHSLIAEAAGNSILAQFRQIMHPLGVARLFDTSSVPRAIVIALEEHYAIYEAIKSRDEDLAEATMRVHLNRSKALFLQLYGEQ